MSIMKHYIAKITPEMDSAYQKTVYRHIGHHSMTIIKTVDFYRVHGGHLGFMKIKGVAKKLQVWQPSQIFSRTPFHQKSEEKTSLYSTFLGSENFKWAITSQEVISGGTFTINCKLVRCLAFYLLNGSTLDH